MGMAPGVANGAWPGFPAAPSPSPGTSAGGHAVPGPSAGSWFGGPAAAGLAAGGWPGGAGGMPDWWMDAAAAALGPDWLRADTQGVFTRASPSASATEEARVDERVAVQATSALAPVRSASTRRRRGGCLPRPPPAVPAAPAAVDVDLTDASSADWCDENTRIVCEIFADEVQKGNRTNTHLSKTGYKNVIQRFQDRTGLLYTRMQFKNKWDKLKGDYGIWKQLVNRETGIGWDETKTNIVMSDTWWAMTAQLVGACSSPPVLCAITEFLSGSSEITCEEEYCDPLANDTRTFRWMAPEMMKHKSGHSFCYSNGSCLNGFSRVYQMENCN